MTDLDLLIIGGYYETRKRYIDSYLMGIYANGPGERTDPIFHSVAKVSTRGLKFMERRKLNEDLREHWKPVEVKQGGRKGGSSVAPQCLEWKNAVPDVWIEPSKSIVLEIKATELTRTDNFRTSHALKFARIVDVRADKPWYDSCTLAEFEQLCGKSGTTGVEKLAKRHITRDDAKKKVTKRQKVVEMGNSRRFIDHLEKVSKICENLNFCILSTSRNMPSIEEIRELILKHSGQIVENPSSSTFAIIAGDVTLNVRKYAEKKLYNIVKVEWLMRVLGSVEIPKKLPKFHPKDMISCTRDLEDYFTKSYDDYGDSYTTPVNCATLKDLLCDFQLDRSQRLLRRELIAIENEINVTGNFFRPFSIYFFANNQCRSTKLAEIMFKSHHGNVINEFISSDSTIIAINPVEEFLVQFRQQYANAKENEGEIKLISIEWITKCHHQGKLEEMSNYLIPFM